MDETVESVLPQHGNAHTLKLQFTGSGSEYFRIWIVNLLLTLVTLGIYFPWAKVRKLRYFYGNTLVGGEPLGFHGDPKKMFKGYALVALLFACYSIAKSLSPVAGMVGLLLGAALWPALMKASLQFRLANTSWRGLRFHFAGDLPGAYGAVLPFFVPAVLISCLSATIPDPEHAPHVWQLKAVGLLTICAVFLAPWFFWRVKKYQHNNYALGAQQTGFDAGVGSLYKLASKILVLYIALAALIPIAMLVGDVSMFKPEPDPDTRNQLGKLVLLFLLAFVLLMVGVYIFATSRIQNLIWNHTASSHIRFASQLRFKPLLWLTLKNWFFMAFTLGLYWPFAAVGIQRLRVESMSLDMAMAPEQLVADSQEHADDATGLAAGDFFGFDIGL